MQTRVPRNCTLSRIAGVSIAVLSTCKMLRLLDLPIEILEMIVNASLGRKSRSEVRTGAAFSWPVQDRQQTFATAKALRTTHPSLKTLVDPIFFAIWTVDIGPCPGDTSRSTRLLVKNRVSEHVKELHIKTAKRAMFAAVFEQVLRSKLTKLQYLNIEAADPEVEFHCWPCFYPMPNFECLRYLHFAEPAAMFYLPEININSPLLQRVHLSGTVYIEEPDDRRTAWRSELDAVFQTHLRVYGTPLVDYLCIPELVIERFHDALYQSLLSYMPLVARKLYLIETGDEDVGDSQTQSQTAALTRFGDHLTEMYIIEDYLEAWNSSFGNFGFKLFEALRKLWLGRDIRLSHVVVEISGPGDILTIFLRKDRQLREVQVRT